MRRPMSGSDVGGIHISTVGEARDTLVDLGLYAKASMKIPDELFSVRTATRYLGAKAHEALLRPCLSPHGATALSRVIVHPAKNI